MTTFKGPLAQALLKAFQVDATPDPWDEKIDEAVRGKEFPAVCPRCLKPGSDETWLCPKGGWPTDDYVNVMPYLYIYSIGAFFRSRVGD